MKGLLTYKSLQDHMKRFEAIGYQVMANTLDPNQLRADALQVYQETEMLDEVEEMNLFYRHYHLLYAFQ